MNRTTIADVAKVAGVSKATVSRVLSGNYNYMRPDTRTRVEEAIEKLNYRPSSVARSLTSNRTNTAALLVSDVSNPFYGDVIHGVESVAFTRNYDIFLCNTNYDVTRGMNFVRSLVDKRVDGVLIMSSSVSDLWLEELRKNRVPVVISDWKPAVEMVGVNAIDVDFKTGIQQAADHLIGLGHTRIAHVSGSLELRTARNRRDLFLQAVATHGISAESVLVVEGNLQIDGGRQAMKRILNQPVRPTAIFAANDLTAMGIMAEARTAGLRVPDDLSVVGVDDIWLADQIEPPLTTVALPRHEIGRTGMTMLFDLMALDSEDDTILPRSQVHTALVIRKSTGLAP